MKRFLALACLAMSAAALRPTLATLRKPIDRVHSTRLSSSLLPGWSEAADENGQTFFFNEATGESQWEAPLAQQDQAGYMPAMDSLPPGWSESVDENGQTFFFNEVTGESQWEAPLAQDQQSSAQPKAQPKSLAGPKGYSLLYNSRIGDVTSHPEDRARFGLDDTPSPM